MSLQTRLTALAQAVGADIKTLNSKVLVSGAVNLDPWHTVGAASEPAFQNSWVNYNTAAYPVLQFRKNPFGKVQFRGAAKNGSLGTAVFTLPVGYRPPTTVSFMAYTSATTFCAWQIGPDGLVLCFYRNDFCDAAVIEFDTDTVTQVLVGPKGDKGDTGATGGNATATLDPWHTVGAAGQPAFTAPFSAYEVVQFRKNPFGRVTVRGLAVTSGSSIALNANIFTFPSTHKPAGNPRIVCEVTNPDSSKCLVQVMVSGADGTVRPIVVLSGVFNGGAGTFINLNEIEFDTDSVTDYMVGPQGPKGDPGGFVGLMDASDPLNIAPYGGPFRSKLAFLSPNYKLTDGGAADPFGGGDYIGIKYAPSRGSVLPSIGAVDGLEYELIVSSSPRVVWRFKYNAGWEFIGGPPLEFHMFGENAAYAGLGNGNLICVNASSKVLQWVITPLVDVWLEAEFFVGLVQKMDAAYHYLTLSAQCSPAPAVNPASIGTAYRTQHSSVQQFENYIVKGRWGLSAGVAYAINCGAGISGGSWTYYQGQNALQLLGKAWPR